MTDELGKSVDEASSLYVSVGFHDYCMRTHRRPEITTLPGTAHLTADILRHLRHHGSTISTVETIKTSDLHQAKL